LGRHERKRPLWQIQVKRDGDSLAPAKPLLSGIVFYQSPTTETSCGVRAHGRESVYRIACDRIGASPMK
jgi:hypothetical protein